MLAIRVRVRPWRALLSFSSSGRLTVTSPSAWLTAIRLGTRCDSSPLGPLTLTTESSPTVTWTPPGTLIGMRPMRDIAHSFAGGGLPDVGQDLTAHVLAPGLAPGHQPLGGGEDHRPQSAQDARNLLAPAVDPQTGLAHPAQSGERGGA